MRSRRVFHWVAQGLVYLLCILVFIMFGVASRLLVRHDTTLCGNPYQGRRDPFSSLQGVVTCFSWHFLKCQLEPAGEYGPGR